MSEIKNLSQLLDAMRKGYRISKNKVRNPQSSHAAPRSIKEERHFCVSIAGHAIGVDSMYSEVYMLCKEYLCENEPEIRISINEDDIAYERRGADLNRHTYTEGYLETLAVYRKISMAILDFNIFLMHGAVIAYENDAYMFTAKSGTGKTTHIRKWLEKLPNAYVVNGDKPLIKLTETEAIACGTPWCGKEGMGTNIMVPLRAIVLMERGEDNQISEITFTEAFAFLLQQTYQPDEAELLKKTIRLLSHLKGKMRYYRFICNNMKEDALSVAYNALTGDKI